MTKYKKHIFICTNQKDKGKQCCGEKSGMKLVDEFKSLIKKNKLQHEFRAQKAGCLDVCSSGPALVIYPEGIFYGNVKTSDIEEIFEEHVLKNRIVKRLKLDFE